MDTAEKTFNFARQAKEKFAKGTKMEKRTILAALGLNLMLENRLLRLDLLKPLESIKEAATFMSEEAKRFEPND